MADRPGQLHDLTSDLPLNLLYTPLDSLIGVVRI